MSTRLIGLTLALVAALPTFPIASAQTFLERISEQLQQSTSSNEAPPLQPADNTIPTPARESLPAPRELSPAPSFSRGSLGLRVSDVTEAAVRANQLVVRQGALITAIEKGSPADKAGLPLGGVIVAIDGRRVDSPEDLANAVRAIRSGRSFEITYYERNRLSRKIVQLNPGQTPEVETEAVRNRPAPVPLAQPPVRQPSLGQQIGGNGTRPLLDRIGRVLDNVVAPAQAVDPNLDPNNASTPAPTIANRIDPNSEIATLRSQVEQLQRQVESLQKSIESLEKRLADK